jgi:hypothetical protein
MVSDMDTIATQITGDSILSHLVNEKTVNQPVLTSTFCAFFINSSAVFLFASSISS